MVINDLNQNGARELPLPTDSVSPPPYRDSSGDGWVTSLDALRVINLLNVQADAESESEGEAEWMGPANFSSPVENHSSLEFVSDTGVFVESLIQVELEHDYLYHCQAIDLTLSLWVSCNDKSVPEEVEELELLPVS